MGLPATAKLQLTSCQLVVVDMQTRLSTAMPPDDLQQVCKQTAALLQGAKLLAIPTIITEQYPTGLGETLPMLKAHASEAVYVEKTAFSACGEPRFNQKLHRDGAQIILTGMEAHICVLQTALDLTALGKQVFVVEDAILSRNPNNNTNAVARMREAGCIITNTESVLFECLGHAKHEAFKAISALIR